MTRISLTLITGLVYTADHRIIEPHASSSSACIAAQSATTMIPDAPNIPLFVIINELDEANKPSQASLNSPINLLPDQSKHLPDLLKSYLLQEIKTLTGEYLDELLTSADYFALDPAQITMLIDSAAAKDLKALLYVYKKRCERHDGSEVLIKASLEKISPFIPHTDIKHRHKRVASIAVINPHQLLSAGSDHTAVIFNEIEPGRWHTKYQLGNPYNNNPENGHVRSLTHALSCNETTIITASFDCTCIVWEKNDELKWTLKQRLGTIDNSMMHTDGHSNAVLSLTRIDDMTFASTSFDQTILIWQKDDAKNWQLAQRLGVENNEDELLGHVDHVTCAALVDATTLASGSDDTTVIIWKEHLGQWLIEHQLGIPFNHNACFGHTGRINSIIALDATTLVTGSSDHSAIVWKKQANETWKIEKRIGSIHNKEITTGHIHDITAITRLDEKTFISCAHHEPAIIWQRTAPNTWNILQRLTALPEIDEPRSDNEINVILKIDDTRIASAHQNASLLLWKKSIDELLKISEH